MAYNPLPLPYKIPTRTHKSPVTPVSSVAKKGGKTMRLLLNEASYET